MTQIGDTMMCEQRAPISWCETSPNEGDLVPAGFHVG